MQDLSKRLTELQREFLKAYEKLAIEEKIGKLSELERQIADPEIWKNVEEATTKNQEAARLSSEVQPWELLKTQISDLTEMLEIADDELKDEIAEQITAMEDELTRLKQELKFRGPYDGENAIIRITSGAGGTEAILKLFGVSKPCV